MAVKPTTFEVHAAARLAGLSTYMVDYLCRSGVLMPTGSKSRGRGKKRLYTFGDVVMLRAISKLLIHGIAVSRLKRGLAALRKHHPAITKSSLPASLLCTDGQDVYFKQGHDIVRDLNSGQFAFAFIVELGAVRKEVAMEMSAVAPRRTGRAAA